MEEFSLCSYKARNTNPYPSPRVVVFADVVVVDFVVVVVVNFAVVVVVVLGVVSVGVVVVGSGRTRGPRRAGPSRQRLAAPALPPALPAFELRLHGGSPNDANLRQ